MPKFYTLNLVKITKKSKPTIRISSEEYIPRRGEKVQMIGMFKWHDEAEFAVKVKGAATLRALWGKEVYLECVNGTIRYASVERRRQFFASFVR